MIRLLSLLACSLLLFSCAKEPGVGGQSSIEGIVLESQLDVFGNTIGTYEKLDERVYIRYGEGAGFDDDTRTAYDGSFKFDYLFEGDYTLYVISDCDSCFSGQQAIIQTISLDKKQDLNLPDFEIVKLP